MMMAVRLSGYREWTEILGDDREWRIQEAQFRLALGITKEADRQGTIPFMTTFDAFLVPTIGIKAGGARRIFQEAIKVAPVLPSGCVRSGRTPLEAQRQASECANNMKPGEFDDEVDSKEGEVWIAHFDVNGFSRNRLSLYERAVWVNEVFLKLSKELMKLGAVAQYMGGDNMVALIDPSTLQEVKDVLNGFGDKLKAGVGKGKNPKEAAARATEALNRIRKKREDNWVVVGSST
ncbi:GTP cyclohydrolase [Sulfodiicoccus acidiphilus]|uniref:GTP cyclohydrolase III n=1 Tax=Sulfodiicoccus acidiphilus TaxID=1670455 RepID=A0A348B182_9CREN|nr:GTP cyclohydrolase IIa [Sulfodiicoccus acidiphilus]BBD71934.1 GTP cyclohydrolase [Sulfodiicoccus acidiphilus]GGT91574.1 GTP cyclohydrolase [Sulfodiicoccus acidiphilus]